MLDGHVVIFQCQHCGASFFYKKGGQKNAPGLHAPIKVNFGGSSRIPIQTSRKIVEMIQCEGCLQCGKKIFKKNENSLTNFPYSGAFKI